MGKRFKELAEQAGLYDFVFEAMGVDEELTNFAELIVLECAVIVGSMEEPHQDIAKLIKQHFELED